MWRGVLTRPTSNDTAAAAATAAATRHKCPYLDTVNRSYLDFDFEKVCSISLSNMNVYCCLVCGKFFQGRGKNTHAHTHSVQAFHHVFMNLHNAKIYCLPGTYVGPRQLSLAWQ